MLLKASKFFLYVSLFSVVIVMTSTFFPFIGGKDYFFRFSVELALIFFILWWAYEAREGEVYSRLKNVFDKPLFIAVSIFVLVFLLASIFAYDPNAAFWSNYERGEGGFQMLHYYAFFLLLTLLFDKAEDWRRIFKVSLVAAVLMILYGVAAAAFLDSFIGQYRDAVGRPLAPSFFGRLFTPLSRFQGSLGNPAYVGPYLMFSIFYVLYLWLNRERRGWTAGALGYGGLIILFLLFFILTQDRAAFLGLTAAVFSFLGCLIFLRSKFRKYAASILVVFAVVVATLVYYRDSSVVKNLPGGRLFDISFSADSAQTRFWTWGSAWAGFKEKPVLGWGPENFSPVFDKYFDARHFMPGKNTETWFDRAHSIFFDYLAETGIAGLLSYLAVFAVFYWQFFRKELSPAGDGKLANDGRIADGDRKRHNYSASEAALIFSVPVGYLVQGAALFEVLPLYINLFLFLAFGYYYLYQRPQSKSQ